MADSTKTYRVVRGELRGNRDGKAMLVKRDKNGSLVGTLRLEGKFQGAFGRRALNALLAHKEHD